MRIIPAIDIIDGKCVRLSKGDYNTKKIYNENPLEVAKEFQDYGIEYLHLVDLDGAKSKHIVNYKVLKEIAAKTKLKIDFGGGIKSPKDFEIAFENGASQVTAGSMAAQNPELFFECLETYGAKKIILGADFRDRKIAAQAWLEETETDVTDFIAEYEKQGIRFVICTDISKDGMLQGASEDIYREILTQTNVNLIASGGVAELTDLDRMNTIGCEGTILGKAIYENKISLSELKTWIENN
jgi:phosphoribosylformimino-5-aminoimidazole carboxamide ribotide isomerase